MRVLADPSPDPSRGTAAATEAKRWRDLRKRFLSAIVLGPAALLCVWLGAEPFTALMAVCVAVLAWEWVHLCGLRTRVLPGAAVPAAVLAAGALAVVERPGLAWAALGGGFALAWFAASRSRSVARAGRPPFWLALGVLYIGVAGLCLIALRHDNGAGRDNLLFLLAVVWASDIGAYLAGRTFGGPKLWPAVTPSKTWSGAAGGLLLAMGTGALLAGAVLAPGSVAKAAAVAAVLAVATQAGDLLESAIKRRFGVKDSSSLIPGHGGLLDRLDGLLAAAPVAALMSLGTGYGVPLWR